MRIHAIVRHIQQPIREPGVQVRGGLGKCQTRFAEPGDLLRVGLPVCFAVQGVAGFEVMFVEEGLHVIEICLKIY